MSAICRLPLIIAAMVIGAFPAIASPIVIDFSFYNVTGNVPGVVTGELDFATSGTNVAATGVYLFSLPSKIAAQFPAVGYGFNWIAAGAAGNIFTVTAGGQVTAASLYLGSTNILALNFQGIVTGVYDGLGDKTENRNSGLAGITFTAQSPPVTDVPEPMSAALFGTGLLALATVGRTTTLAGYWRALRLRARTGCRENRAST